MKINIYLASIFTFIFQGIYSQVILNSDKSKDTYTLINSVFANSNRNVVEAPDCNHNAFGNHITQEFDIELNKDVFLFHIHVSPDNDRCKKFDRQRNEIKTYSDSPENVKANIGETVEYKWKFKISSDFKPSTSFTHIHQIKSVGGPYSSIPMISFTLRKSNLDRLELRYTSTKKQKTLKTANLDLFRGNWVEVTEVIKFGDVGSYSVEIKKISNNEIIFNYSNSPLDLWQDGAEFSRPKWGIYRSLNHPEDLKDEIVKYADFIIEEITDKISVETLKEKAENILLFPNPSSKEVTLKKTNLDNYDTIEMYDYSGRNISIDKKINKNKLDVSGFSKGLYYIVFKKKTVITKVLKCYVK